ncbi:MAG: GFA family protein [Marinicella sp.]
MAKYQDQNSSITQQENDEPMIISGGCHCQAIRFTAKITQATSVLICNCSICSMTGFHHLIAKHDDFTLLSGESKLTSYRFNTGQADHLFCKICGVKSFYQPRSHPDSWSINTNCIDDFNPSEWSCSTFDGKNWQLAKESLDLLK